MQSSPSHEAQLPRHGCVTKPLALQRGEKRLFLTATPRHYNLRRRDREGDAQRGRRCPAHPWNRRAGVIISVVTSGMLNDHLLRHGEVLVQGDAVQARHVASHLALQAAVAVHGTGKIFTLLLFAFLRITTILEKQ